jgi:hypothetical protein
MGQAENKENNKKDFWQWIEQLSKAVPALAALVGLLSGLAAIVGRTYVHAQYEALGIPLDSLGLKVPENNFLGWMYLGFSTVNILTGFGIILGLAILMIVGLSATRKLRKRIWKKIWLRYIVLMICLVLVIDILFLHYFIPEGLTEAIIFFLAPILLWWMLTNTETESLEEKRIRNLIPNLSSMFIYTLVIIYFLLYAAAIMSTSISKTKIEGWNAGEKEVCHSQKINLNAEHPVLNLEPNEKLALTSSITETLLHQGFYYKELYLLRRTDEEFFVFTETVPITQEQASILTLGRTKTYTYNTPARVKSIPKSDIHGFDLISDVDKPNGCD